MMQNQAMEQHLRDQIYLSIKMAEVAMITGYDFWQQITVMNMRLATHSLRSIADLVQTSTSFFQSLLGIPNQRSVHDYPPFPSTRNSMDEVPQVPPPHPARSSPAITDPHSQSAHPSSNNGLAIPDATTSSARKHDIAPVEPAYGFYFRGPNGWYDLMANSLTSFIQYSDEVDDATWLYHLQQGDYSNWFRYVIRDDELANETLQIEQWVEAKPADKRRRLQEVIKARYIVGD